MTCSFALVRNESAVARGFVTGRDGTASDYAAILEAIAAVEAIAALQQRRLDGLRARLSSL